jgi:hypothetical protein
MHTIHGHYALTHDSNDKFVCKRTKKTGDGKKKFVSVFLQCTLMSRAPKLEIYYMVWWNIEIQLGFIKEFVHNPSEVAF